MTDLSACPVRLSLSGLHPTFCRWSCEGLVRSCDRDRPACSPRGRLPLTELEFASFSRFYFIDSRVPSPRARSLNRPEQPRSVTARLPVSTARRQPASPTLTTLASTPPLLIALHRSIHNVGTLIVHTTPFPFSSAPFIPKPVRAVRSTSGGRTSRRHNLVLS